MFYRPLFFDRVVDWVYNETVVDYVIAVMSSDVIEESPDSPLLSNR